MAFNAGNISASLKLDISNFISSIKKASVQAKIAGNTIRTSIGSGNNTINMTTKSVNKVKDNMKDLNRIVGGILISQIFYKALNSIQDATSAVITFSGNIEKARIAFQYFLGSTKDADAFINNMKDFAATTAYSTEQSLLLARRLMAAQFKPEAVRPVLEILNDTASATGGTADQLDRIILALTQIKTKGKLMGQELRQLAEANIPVYQILQEQLHLTGEQVADIGNQNISGVKAVDAILTGLQKRYKGAAKEIAQTLPGMLDTLHDDSLIISQKLFEKPYAALEKFVGKWRDTWEEMRKTVTKSGVGGLLEEFVPKSWQPTIRIIVGSIYSLASGFNELRKAIAPVFEVFAGGSLKVMAAVLPLIATLVHDVASLVDVAMKASPIVKDLGGAIVGLMVATTVTKALLFLWRIVGMGALCAGVAGAVRILGNAIKGLFTIMVTSKIGFIITVIAAALAYLAIQTGWASKALNQLNQEFAKLAGINIGDILQPTDNSDIVDYMNKYNKWVKDMGSGLSDVGKGAEKAGKKVKDKFAASFDELYQVPDKLDQISGGLGDIGNLPSGGLDTLPPPPPAPGGATGGGAGGDGGGSGIGGGGSGGILALTLAGVMLLVKAFDKLKDKLKDLKKAGKGVLDGVRDWVKDAKKSIDDWVTDVNDDLVRWKDKSKATMGQFAADALASLTGWAAGGLAAILGFTAPSTADLQKWYGDAITSVSTFCDEALSDLTNLATMGLAAISGFTIPSYDDITQWSTNSITTFTDFRDTVDGLLTSMAASGLATVLGFTGQTSADIEQWATDNSNRVSSFAGSTLGTLDRWSLGGVSTVLGFTSLSKADISKWAADTTLTISTWAASTLANILGWETTGEGDFATFRENVTTNIKQWASETGNVIANWSGVASGNIAGFADAGMSSVATFATNSEHNISQWARDTSSSVSSWVTTNVANLNAFSSAGVSALSSFAGAGWNVLKDFMSSTHDSVESWASGIMDTISSIAKALGKDISGAVSFSGFSMGSKPSVHMPGPITAVLTAIAATAETLFGVQKAGIWAPKFETGGFVSREQLIHVAEGNKREAIIPMENMEYMKPFSQAVARDLASMMPQRNNNDMRNIMYVGTLIADDRSLKELERKLKVVRISDDRRGGNG